MKDNVSWNGTNESGFTALPSGSRAGSTSTYNFMGDYCHFWSSTENNNDNNGNINGNASGPPDEVYVYRPGGTTIDNGNLTQAVFSAETGRTEIIPGLCVIGFAEDFLTGDITPEYNTSNL